MKDGETEPKRCPLLIGRVPQDNCITEQCEIWNTKLMMCGMKR